MNNIFLILIVQTIIIFIIFRKFYFNYDKLANITRLSLLGIPLSILLYLLNLKSFSIYFLISSLSILGLYIEFVSYAQKKDEGYIE